ncbi:hemerythrin domain-containing protein [Kribbia dieselivorans]|uniref:hemerythrin domain-containing protein n=1 Tax=Kribbia dieselivorans TaxID=331526 RepID=UPI0008385BA5|nr:hemerythrin domain-containing protein [Kribbia dieselivorans]
MSEHHDHHHEHHHHHGSADHLDAASAEQIRAHHKVMVADLDRLSAAYVAQPDSSTREPLLTWFREVLVPHAAEEEVSTYAACAKMPEGRLLIDAMVREHVLIRRLVELVGTTTDPVAAAAYGRAVFEAFESHQLKENEIILPLLLEG